MRWFLTPRPRSWIIHVDGAIRPERDLTGLAAVVRNTNGQILHWWCRQTGGMTNNEAEYAAAIFALEKVISIPFSRRPHIIALYSDSCTLVDQMRGRALARASGLRRAKAHLASLASRFDRVTYHHITREHNRLADALAYDVLDGVTALVACYDYPGSPCINLTGGIGGLSKSSNAKVQNE
jgi:ribonuclease HI